MTKHFHPKLFETNLKLHSANVLVHNDFIKFDKLDEKFVFLFPYSKARLNFVFISLCICANQCKCMHRYSSNLECHSDSDGCDN